MPSLMLQLRRWLCWPPGRAVATFSFSELELSSYKCS